MQALKVLKVILIVILCMILCPILIALPYVVAVNKTIMNSESLSNIIVETGVSSEIKNILDQQINESINLVEENMKNNSENNEVDQVKVDEVKKQVTETLGTFNDEENIDALITDFIETICESGDLKLNDLLKTNINKVIKDNNLNVSSDTQKEIDDYIDKVTEEINQNLNTNTDGLIKYNATTNTITNPIPDFLHIVSAAQYTLIGIIVVIVVIIMLLNFKTISSGLKTINGCLITAGFISLTGTLVLYAMKKGLRASDVPKETTYKLIKNMLETFSKSVNTVIIIYFAIAIAIIIGLKVAKNIKDNRPPEIA